jgi:glutathione S-transferase
MLTIYGHPMSTCTRKVLMTLAENELPFEMSVVDFATGAHKQEPHISRQPFGRIPAMNDDGFELFESRAICRYLDEKGSKKLVPADAKARAKMEQWISIETSEFTGNAMKFVYKHIFQRPQEDAVMESATKGLEAALGVLEKQLAKTPYLVGKDLTLADVCYMPYFEYAMNTPAKDIISKYPSVVAWWDRVRERPTWKKATTAA